MLNQWVEAGFFVRAAPGQKDKFLIQTNSVYNFNIFNWVVKCRDTLFSPFPSVQNHSKKSVILLLIQAVRWGATGGSGLRVTGALTPVGPPRAATGLEASCLYCRELLKMLLTLEARYEAQDREFWLSRAKKSHIVMNISNIFLSM